MIVFVDTPVWSLALRRKNRTESENQICFELSDLVRNVSIGLIGSVRQELLTGIKDRKTFELLRNHMCGIAEIPFVTSDFEMAAQYCNACRAKGIQGSSTDFLLCAVATRYDAPIFTTDRDFESYAKHLKFQLHKISKR
jgi:predicted nucleic acid-binding protein